MLLEQGGASQAAPDILALGADYQGVDTGDFGLRTVGGRVFGPGGMEGPVNPECDVDEETQDGVEVANVEELRVRLLLERFFRNCEQAPASEGVTRAVQNPLFGLTAFDTGMVRVDYSGLTGYIEVTGEMTPNFPGLLQAAATWL